MKGLRFSKLASKPTYAEGRANLDANGASMVGLEFLVEASWIVGGDLVIPNGTGLVIPMVLSQENPPGLFTFGAVVPAVLKFASTNSLFEITLNSSWEVVGSQNVRQWFWDLELGFNLDSLTPDPPATVFSSVGGSDNTNVHVQTNRTFTLGSPPAGQGQLQHRVSHDGGSPITITPSILSIVSSGEGSGKPMRLA